MPTRKLAINVGVTPSRKRKSTRKTRKSKMTTVVQGRGPIAARTIAKLKYTQDVQSNGSTFSHVWNANSIFDPDRTGTGHQPYGHDTYESLYNRYRVLKVSYRIQMANLSTTVNSTWKAIVVTNNSNTAYTSDTLPGESPNSVTKLLPSGNAVTFKGVIYPWTITGVTKKEYMDDDRFQAQFGASPTEFICLQMVYAGIGGSVPPINTVAFNIVLIYTVEMFDPKELAQS